MVIGGNESNTRLWMTDNNMAVWRKSMDLPYSGTVYHPTTFIKDNKAINTRLTKLNSLLQRFFLNFRFT